MSTHTNLIDAVTDATVGDMKAPTVHEKKDTSRT